MPRADANHAANIVRSALEIMVHCEERNRTHPVPLHLRIGIHSGKVVGAVVGIKKYIYDVFGATINIASRMQSHSEPMKINISEATRILLGPEFQCVKRDATPVKGLGTLNMYFLQGQPEASAPAISSQESTQR